MLTMVFIISVKKWVGFNKNEGTEIMVPFNIEKYIFYTFLF